MNLVCLFCLIVFVIDVPFFIVVPSVRVEETSSGFVWLVVVAATMGWMVRRGRLALIKFSATKLLFFDGKNGWGMMAI